VPRNTPLVCGLRMTGPLQFLAYKVGVCGGTEVEQSGSGGKRGTAE